MVNDKAVQLLREVIDETTRQYGAVVVDGVFGDWRDKVLEAINILETK